MAEGKQFTGDEARRIGTQLGINWDEVNPEQFRKGLAVEMEHGSHDPETDVTHDDPLLTGKVAWAHIKEYPDYYTRLEQMEKEAEHYWAAHTR
ncbi:MAG: DUF5661 family protein [Thermomicrobiales bacterium]